MTPTTELNWKYLGTVNVDIGVLLIADEQHFRDLHNKWDDAYDAALNDYEAKIESNAVVPLLYSVIMGELVDQSRKSMEHMTEEQKAQIQDIVKEEKN